MVAYIILILRSLLLSPSIPSLYTAVAIIIYGRFCRRDRHLSMPYYFSLPFCRCRHLIKIVAIYRCRLLMLSPCHLSLSPYLTVAIYCFRLLSLSLSIAVALIIVVAIYRFRRLSLSPFITFTLCRYLLDRILSL